MGVVGHGGHAVGHQTAEAGAAVGGGDDDLRPQRPELLCQEDLGFPVETQHRGDALTLCGQPLGEAVQRRDAHAAAHQQGVFPAAGHIVTVAKTCQHIQFRAGSHARHGLGAVAQDFINKRQFSIGPVAHGDGTAEEKARELQIHELAGGGDGRGVPRQPQTVDPIGQPCVFSHRQGCLLHNHSPFSRRSASYQTAVSPAAVSRQRPWTSHPVKGVALPMERKSAGSIR